MPVTPSGSLIQALSSLIQPAGGQATKPGKPAATEFRSHIDPVSAKLSGDDRPNERRQGHTNPSPSAPPEPPPGRGSLVNLLV
ncbi:MAG: hypothetical protein AAFW76_00810 [Pseudomonadota bacterium]